MAVTQERLTLRNLYLYLVCLITLVISIFAAVNLVRSTVRLLYPDPGYYGGYETGKPGEPAPAAQRASQQASQRHDAILSLVGSGTTLLIVGPLYGYHWRRVQKELPPPPRPADTGSPEPSYA